MKLNIEALIRTLAQASLKLTEAASANAEGPKRSEIGDPVYDARRLLNTAIDGLDLLRKESEVMAAFLIPEEWTHLITDDVKEVKT